MCSSFYPNITLLRADNHYIPQIFALTAYRLQKLNFKFQDVEEVQDNLTRQRLAISQKGVSEILPLREMTFRFRRELLRSRLNAEFIFVVFSFFIAPIPTLFHQISYIVEFSFIYISRSYEKYRLTYLILKKAMNSKYSSFF